jgi:hypothetical protein
MDNLETVLEKSDSILVDGSVTANGINILEHLNLKNPTTSVRVIENRIKRSQLLLQILNAPSTRTIPAVSNEKLTYHTHVTKSLNYFARQENCPNDFLEAIRELHRTSFQEYEAIENNSTSTNHPAYQTLHKMVLLLSQTIRLKHDTAYLKGEKDNDTSYHSDTDEQLASTVLWESMQHHHTPALFTNDRDFDNLLTITPWILGSKHFLPHNQTFRNNVYKNRFNIYRINYNRADQLALPSYAFNFQNGPQFWIPKQIPYTHITQTPIGPRIGTLSPQSKTKEVISIQHQLYQHWEKLASQLEEGSVQNKQF